MRTVLCFNDHGELESLGGVCKASDFRRHGFSPHIEAGRVQRPRATGITPIVHSVVASARPSGQERIMIREVSEVLRGL